MADQFNLERFVEAQQGVFNSALTELKSGMKKSHWMWFIFPQLAGLGHSSTAQFFAIASIDEARAYLAHPLLGSRLRQCVEEVLAWAGRRSAIQIFGPIDAVKFRSCLTLFDQVQREGVFGDAIGAFFETGPDDRTLALLNAER